MIKRNDILYFDKFLEFSNLIHGFSTRAFGSMKKADGSVDCDHLEKFRNAIGMNERAVCMEQVHGGNVAVIEKVDKFLTTGVDAQITDKKRLPLAVITADCLPILLYDPKRQVIGVVHAGNKGLQKQVIGNTLERLKKNFKSDPKDIIVTIGPAIETYCYEVGREMVDSFVRIFPSFSGIYTEKGGKFFLNLRNIALQCFLKEGILEENIEIVSICTKCSDEFFSYRKGDKTGRFISLIEMI